MHFLPFNIFCEDQSESKIEKHNGQNSYLHIDPSHTLCRGVSNLSQNIVVLTIWLHCKSGRKTFKSVLISDRSFDGQVEIICYENLIGFDLLYRYSRGVTQWFWINGSQRISMETKLTCLMSNNYILFRIFYRIRMFQTGFSV